MSTSQTPLPTRVSKACDRCRRNKSRCDSYRPCSLCLRASVDCITTGRSAVVSTVTVGDGASPSSRARSTPQQREENPNRRKRRRSRSRDDQSGAGVSPSSHTPGSVEQSSDVHTFAIEQNTLAAEQIVGNGNLPVLDNIESVRPRFNESRGPATQRGKPTASYLLNALPSEAVMLEFLDAYWSSVHWFSLVIYEPTFRPLFDYVRTGTALPSQRPFLLLLSTVLGLGAWYHAQRPRSAGGLSSEESKQWSEKLIANAESRMIELLDQSSMTAVQTLTLLGSFFVYHGRPNLSFSLLGATVKSAHAAGLHKSSTTASRNEMEERKRVWWTIYTWDRFASITYGRPVGIDERDCSVSMPDDVDEMVDFSEPGQTRGTPICFSTYQRELNKLYMIASPAIKRVYRAQQDAEPGRAREYHSLIEEVTHRLWRWRHELPPRLSLNLTSDCPATLDLGSKAHYLQSLSLHLTFDSLLIILHRPFLKRHLSVLQRHGLTGENGLGVSSLDASRRPNETIPPSRESSEGILEPANDSSQQQWWNAAVRTSKVIELPQLAQFASDGHLVAFMAINLFNAAIVMVVLSLLDPLANRAQEAKRAIARIYRLQATLGARSTLSKQSSSVLRSLVSLLMRRESDAILAPMVSRRASAAQPSQSSEATSSLHTLSVRETLSMPLGAHLSPGGQISQGREVEASHFASRLDDSLASVQKAITIQPNTNYYPANINETAPDGQLWQNPHGGNPAGSAWDFADASDYEGGIPTDASEWSSGPSDARQGLYWFWDPSWDQLYSDVAEWP